VVVRDVANGAEVPSFKPTCKGEWRVPTPSARHLPKLLDFGVLHGTHTVWAAEGRRSEHSDLVHSVVLNGSVWLPARSLAVNVKAKLTCITLPKNHGDLLVDAVAAVETKNDDEADRLVWTV
jgi:hypothetical protein